MGGSSSCLHTLTASSSLSLIAGNPAVTSSWSKCKLDDGGTLIFSIVLAVAITRSPRAMADVTRRRPKPEEHPNILNNIQVETKAISIRHIIAELYDNADTTCYKPHFRSRCLGHFDSSVLEVDWGRLQERGVPYQWLVSRNRYLQYSEQS